MTRAAPSSKAFAVPKGTRVKTGRRDPRFPTLFKVSSHPLDPNPDLAKSIFVFIQDTALDAMEEFGRFEDSLQTPLGRTATMSARGIIVISPPAIIYGRKLGCKDPKEDVLVAYVDDVSQRLPKEAQRLQECVERIRGPTEYVTQEIPTPKNGMQGGLHFERLGQPRVKQTRAISLGFTLQRAKQLWGPPAGAKNVPGRSENNDIRSETLKCTADIAIKTMTLLAPPSLMSILRRAGQCNPTFHVGVHGNTMFPAVQMNISGAVGSTRCKSVGNEDLGLFGRPHADTEDSPGSLTAMISCGNEPDDYEPGRFHLLHLGVCFELRSTYIIGFSGLHRHVGTPPIAPTNQVAPDVTRLMFVLYPTQAGFPEKTTLVTPFAFWPDGSLLSLGPEITTYGGSRMPLIGGSSTIATDGDRMMEPQDYLNVMAQLSLVLMNHIWRQVPARHSAAIDTDRFLSSFSLLHGEQRIEGSPWPEGPDGRAELAEENTASANDRRPPLLPKDRITYSRQSARRDACLAWLAHLERYSAFIPSWSSTDFDALRRQVLLNSSFERVSGPRRSRKGGRGAHSIAGDGAASQSAQRGSSDSHSAIQSSTQLAGTTDRRKTRSCAQKNDPDAPTPTPPSDGQAIQDAPVSSRTRHKRHAQESPPAQSPPKKRLLSYTPLSLDLESESPQSLPSTPGTLEPAADGQGDPALQLPVFSPVDEGGIALDLASESPQSLPSTPGTLEPAADGQGDPALQLPVFSPVDEGALSFPAFSAGNRPARTSSPTVTREHNVEAALMLFSLDKLEAFKSSISAALVQSTVGPKNPFVACADARYRMQHDPLSVETLQSVAEARDRVFDVQQSLATLKLQQWYYQCQIMDTMSATHVWINDTVDSALQSTASSSAWPFNLVQHFREPQSAVHLRLPNGMIRLTLGSFVPQLAGIPTPPYVYAPLYKQRPQHEIDAFVRKRAVDALRTWFQCDDKDAVGVALLAAMRQCPLYSTLFMMDDVWQIYKRPKRGVIHGGAYYSSLVGWTDAVIVEFAAAFRASPLCDPGSAEYRALSDARDLLDGLKHSSRLAHFLRGLLPLLATDGIPRDENPLARFVAQHPDTYSPFRATTPGLMVALDVIYRRIDRVRSPAGLFNIIAFRVVFYGSDYARKQLRWLDDYNGWREILGKYCGTKPAATYFVNKSAYGAPEDARNLNLVETCHTSIDAALSARWSSLIDQRGPLLDVFEFLKTFPHVESRGALLIVCDLIQASFLDEPTVEDMASMMFEGSPDAVKSLVDMQLTTSAPTKDSIAAALAVLHHSIAAEFSADELSMMRYDLPTLQHALDRFTRIQHRKPRHLFR